MPFYKIICTIFFTLFAQYAQALSPKDLLPAEQAFNVSAKAISAELIEVSWGIADGYYLYRNKTSITTLSDGIELGVPDMPAGKTKHDEFFGDVVIYRNQLKITVPITNKKSLSSLKIQVKYQGCADIGICYPPQKKVFTIDLPSIKASSKSDPIKQLVNGLKGLNLSFFQDELLPAEQAFQFSATVKDANTLQVNWFIADGYYLYREKTRLTILDNESIQLGTLNIPQGEPYHDEAFGQVNIFHNELRFDVPLIRSDKAPQTLTLLAKYQGCADRGVCYPHGKQNRVANS